MALWQEAEDILMTDYAAVIPIFHYDRNKLMQPKIEGAFPPSGAPIFRHWRLPEEQTTLRVSVSTEPPSLDVNTVTDTTSHLILRQLMDGLYAYDGESKIHPTGAVSY